MRLAAYGTTLVLLQGVALGTASGACERPGPVVTAPGAVEPAARISVEAPLPEPLAKGLVVLRYRTENLRILPVFGLAALAVSPRIGHLHVRVDDAPWVWADTSGQALLLNGLPPGSHTVHVELVNANHQLLAREVVRFEVPRRGRAVPDPKAAGSQLAAPTPEPRASEPPARILLQPPQPERLARGLVFIQYRTENLQIAPVFGPSAAAISPRIGHVQVTVDDAPWHWADASGGPLIIAGLPPGPHKLLVELVDANHRRLAQELVRFEIPPR